MKKNILLILTSGFLLFLTGCSGFNSYPEGLSEVKDSLSYKDLVGTYVFNPTAYQAERLNIPADSAITLTMEAKEFKSGKRSQFIGTYNISKMVLIMNLHETKPLSAGWSVFYSRDTLNNNNVNILSFQQGLRNGNGMSFQIHRNVKDNALHILGFTSDPKFEVITIVDFKKVK